MRSFTVLLALILTAVLLLALQSSFGSADDSSSGQDAVAECPISQPWDGKPPQQAILRPASSEAEDEIVRQIAHLLLQAQREGRSVDEDPHLWELVRQLEPDQTVILGAEDC